MEFDYIVVGSGAGGGPLAARLVEKGFSVLVLEAGPNQAAEATPARDVSIVPGFHGLSTEHRDLSWRFFVKHYDTPPTGCDPKEYEGPKDKPFEHGIFYPRASGIGGCTVHNAMITIAGPDSDWEDLADFVGDDSWRSAQMRAYFQRLERNDYSPPPTDPPTTPIGRLWDIVRWVFGYAADHARGGHGFRGWLHTSVTDISLGIHDRQLKRMLRAALWQSRRARHDRAWTLVSRFLRGRIFEKLDPNHARTQAEHPEGVVTVPLAVYGRNTTAAPTGSVPYVGRGRRSSPRELLLQTRADCPDRLEIWTDALVTNVLFDGGKTPRAVGVRFLRGARLYKAHQDPSNTPGTPEQVFVRAGGEVILCGGAFNTPQLLMLSGIGDAGHLRAVRTQSGINDVCCLRDRNGRPLPDEHGQPALIDSKGVGRNLQDRYEVTVISKMKRDFSLLDGATFKLPSGAHRDRHLEEWHAQGTGLYTSNGSVLGIFKRSRPDLAQPDLFMFGFPLPFKGYEIGYSNVGDQHDTFTWALLKAHTQNGDGTVRLRSASPQDPPLVNFHYFNEETRRGEGDRDPDLLALVEGVKFVRGIADIAGGPLCGSSVRTELHPGRDEVPPEDEQGLRDWIRRVAWGHHACGTCRMGPDDDPYAVLDSRFRVRGVDGLRVVDASIFPRIPGYFIVTNIYMASEKAADVVAEDRRFHASDTEVYPRELRALEADAIDKRRKQVRSDDHGHGPAEWPASTPTTWPEDVTGLALSGGGVRSATFNLGVLQQFASVHWLRRVDFLSTVSGGGYIGSFLGRAFDRLRTDTLWSGRREPPQSAPDRVEKELNDQASPALFWLRRHGNYIAPGGRGENRLNTAIFIRNFLSVHFVVGALLFAVFGIVNFARYWLFGPASAALNLIAIRRLDLPLTLLLKRILGAFFSPWFVLFELIVVLMVVPRIVAYWIVSPDHHKRYSLPALLVLFLSVASLLYAAMAEGLNFPLFVIGIAPLVGFVHVELAWRRGRKREEAVGRGSPETQRLRTRNYLTYDLSAAVSLSAATLGFAIVDTMAHALQQYAAGSAVYAKAIGGVIAALAAAIPLIQRVSTLLTAGKSQSEQSSALVRLVRTRAMAVLFTGALILIPLVLVSFASHVSFGGGASIARGVAVMTLSLLVALIIGALPSAVVFVNRSSLSQTYAAKLARAYLGATNPLRFRSEGQDVTEVMAGDDVASLADYRPHLAGGPLHLLNVIVNQTVDFNSQRGNRDRKGENMAVSSIGMTIGKWWHAAWSVSREPSDGRTLRKRPTPITPLGHAPGTDHPLIDATGRPTTGAEMLSLRQWMAISGAAFGPGRGQLTNLRTALLFGLTNMRTGYWWDSGITESARDGFPAVSALMRVFYLIENVFLTQFLVLFEWVARYPGPWNRFWYLSDGGFFENLGVYELIRRRVPRIVVCDAGADPAYEFEDFANLMRKVRIDFNAEIVPFEVNDYAAIPEEIRKYLGTLDDLKPQRAEDDAVARSGKHAAMFWVRYNTEPRRRSVLLYLKASTTGDETADVLEYCTKCRDFPHESTADQFFDEAQWESYRTLGRHVASTCVIETPWLWTIPLPPE